MWRSRGKRPKALRNPRRQQPRRRQNQRNKHRQARPSHQHRSHRPSPRANRGKNSPKATGRSCVAATKVCCRRGSACVSRAGERVLAVTNFALHRHNHRRDRVKAKTVSVRHPNQVPRRPLRYLLLVRSAGVAERRGFALALLRTVIVPWLGAGVGDASAYFFVEGQIRRQG